MSSFYGNHGGTGLPEVDATDNGKVLIAQDGEWKPGLAAADGLPVVSNADDGKVLVVEDGEWSVSEKTSDLENLVDGSATGSVRHINANTTIGQYAMAEGIGTKASGNSSHAEGKNTIASVQYAHAEGLETTASSSAAHAEGYGTVASGRMAHAEGNGTIANHMSQHVFGNYNIADDSEANSSYAGNYLEIVGNGSDNNNRSNARTLDWNGNEVLAGKLTVGATPTNNMDVATKLYVDTAVNNAGGGSGSGLPAVTAADNGKALVVDNGVWSVDNVDLGYKELHTVETILDEDITMSVINSDNAWNGLYSYASNTNQDLTQINPLLVTLDNGETISIPLNKHPDYGYYYFGEMDLVNDVPDFTNYPIYINVYNQGDYEIDTPNNYNHVTLTFDKSTIITNNAFEKAVQSIDIDHGYKVTRTVGTELFNDDVTSNGTGNDWYDFTVPLSQIELSETLDSLDFYITLDNQEMIFMPYNDGKYGEWNNGPDFTNYPLYAFFDENYLVFNVPNEVQHVVINALGLNISCTDNFILAVNANLPEFPHIYHMYDGKANGSIISSGAEGESSNYHIGSNAIALGYNVKASGDDAFAEGYNTQANGAYSHAEGRNTIADNGAAHAEGQDTVARGAASHAEGYHTQALQLYSHAEGNYTQAQAYYSHAEGSYTTAKSTATHAEGNYTVAYGDYSHVEGNYTTTWGRSQHTFGEYNIADPSGVSSDNRGTYVEIVGNGTADNARSNARTLDWNGNEVLAGKLTVGAGPVNAMDVTTKQYVDNKIIEAIPAPTSPATGSFLVYNGTAWVAQMLQTWQGGNY